MRVLQGQSGWIHLVGADGIVCYNELPVARRFVAIHTEKGKLSLAHTGHGRKVIIELNFGF